MNKSQGLAGLRPTVSKGNASRRSALLTSREPGRSYFIDFHNYSCVSVFTDISLFFKAYFPQGATGNRHHKNDLTEVLRNACLRNSQGLVWPQKFKKFEGLDETREFLVPRGRCRAKRSPSLKVLCHACYHLKEFCKRRRAL